MARRLKDLGDLAALRAELAQAERDRIERARIATAQREAEAARANEFVRAVGDVQPLRARPRRQPPAADVAPEPRSRWRDDEAVLVSSISDDLDVETWLDIDDSLSWRAAGIGEDVLRRLRRGAWTIQDQIDLHGHRVDEAREALIVFLREAVKRGLRCVRVVHGKGLGSKGKQPVLKGKVRNWLAQKEEVIAFCQARGVDGGAGAVIVLLRPTAGAKAGS